MLYRFADSLRAGSGWNCSSILMVEWLPLSHRNCQQTKTYVKPEVVITVFELLMMGGVSPKTR
jgi:phage baseplate assembly protein gpV